METLFICVTVVGVVALSLFTLYKLALQYFEVKIKIDKYAQDIKLKIEEPVREIPFNKNIEAEITAIKSQLNSLSLSRGITRK